MSLNKIEDYCKYCRAADTRNPLNLLNRMRRIVRTPAPFTQLSLNSLFKGTAVAHVQTDGSFTPLNNRISRTAVILHKASGTKHSLCRTYFNHHNSVESEWQSIADGLEYSAKRGVRTINLENDNLSIVNSLILRKTPPALYSDYYLYIFDMIGRLDWVAIRWIPREMNKADRLFRI